MNNKSKYIGQIFECRWEVTDTYRYKDHTYYMFTNIYNQNKIVLCNTTFRELLRGKTTISKVITSRCRRRNWKSISELIKEGITNG